MSPPTSHAYLLDIIYKYGVLPTPPSFSVSQTIGEIFVTAELDREMRDSYHLTLVATDDGGLSATTLIVITVLDVNDNTPTFRPAVFTLVLIESTDYPSALTVFVSDRANG